MAKMNIPTRLHAGDSLAFTDSVSDYPASAGWLVRYALVTPANKYQFDSTADGDDHDLSVLATKTAQWEPGRYKWAAYAVKGSERKTIGTGSFELLPDLTAGASDQRHHDNGRFVGGNDRQRRSVYNANMDAARRLHPC